MSKSNQRIKGIFLVLVFIVLCSGCGEKDNEYPTNARGVVNAFVKELIEGDIEGALDYCEKGSDAYDLLEPITEDNLIHEFAIGLVSDEDNQQAIEKNKYIRKMIHMYYEYLFKNYQINDYDEEKDEAEYEVSISRIDYDEDSMYEFMVGPDIFYEYYEDNQELLDELYEKEGEDAVMMRYLDDVGKEIAESYQKQLKENATYSNRSYYISLELSNGKWQVIDFVK